MDTQEPVGPAPRGFGRAGVDTAGLCARAKHAPCFIRADSPGTAHPRLVLCSFPNQTKQEELAAGEDVAHCPSCSLVVHVIYNLADFAPTASTKAGGGVGGGAQAVSVA